MSKAKIKEIIFLSFFCLVAVLGLTGSIISMVLHHYQVGIGIAGIILFASLGVLSIVDFLKRK